MSTVCVHSSHRVSVFTVGRHSRSKERHSPARSLPLAELWRGSRETARLRQLVENVKDAELEFAAAEAEEAMRREEEIEFCLRQDFEARQAVSWPTVTSLVPVPYARTAPSSKRSPHLHRPSAKETHYELRGSSSDSRSLQRSHPTRSALSSISTDEPPSRAHLEVCALSQRKCHHARSA